MGGGFINIMQKNIVARWWRTLQVTDKIKNLKLTFEVKWSRYSTSKLTWMFLNFWDNFNR